jgi:hypothetical protein
MCNGREEKRQRKSNKKTTHHGDPIGWKGGKWPRTTVIRQ